MKPIGLKPVKFPSKTDAHPKKGYINFWERWIDFSFSKKIEKQKVKQQIKREIEDYEA